MTQPSTLTDVQPGLTVTAPSTCSLAAPASHSYPRSHRPLDPSTPPPPPPPVRMHGKNGQQQQQIDDDDAYTLPTTSFMYKIQSPFVGRLEKCCNKMEYTVTTLNSNPDP